MLDGGKLVHVQKYKRQHLYGKQLMRNSSCHSPTVLQFAIILTRKRYDLYTPLLTVLLPVGYLWTRHQIVSFFSPSILYKATLIAEIFLVSGGISLNPVPISLCMFGFLTASKGCCSEVNNTEPRQKKKNKKERSLQEPLKRAELLWDQCDKVSHSFKKGALLSRTSLHRTYSFSGKQKQILFRSQKTAAFSYKVLVSSWLGDVTGCCPLLQC